MNYNRYKKYSEAKYNKRGLSYYIMRGPSDKILLPYVMQINNQEVLEVGIGYGYYTKYYLEQNKKVIGVDVNPYLCQNIGIPIIESRADKLKEHVTGKYSRIISFFMTEYLSKQELKDFISQSVSLLDEKGKFATTIILNRGVGRFYVFMAKLKGIEKFCYSMEEINNIANFKNAHHKLTPLKSILNIPYAVLLEIDKI